MLFAETVFVVAIGELCTLAVMARGGTVVALTALGVAAIGALGAVAVGFITRKLNVIQVRVDGRLTEALTEIQSLKRELSLDERLRQVEASGARRGT